MYVPNKKEIENVINLEPFERYKYALNIIADWDRVYTIEEDEDHYLLLGVEDRVVLSIWPAFEYAERCIAALGGTKVVEMDLTLFEEELIAMEPKDLRLNVFSIDSRAGFIVTKDEFTSNLLWEIDNREYPDDEE